MMHPYGVRIKLLTLTDKTLASGSGLDLQVALPDVDRAVTTVVDVTYLCNATCSYCQWGNPKTPGRSHKALSELLIPKETLLSLGTERVVLSGGEPRLHPELPRILCYYRKLVSQVIVITNGYALDAMEVSRLLEAGATGITVSLDSVHSEEAIQTRMTPPLLHRQILANLRQMSTSRSYELGINSVVSHPTANWRTVGGLLDFASEINADFVKFQPVFDDGYVSKSAPHLKLRESDIPNLLEISEEVRRPQFRSKTNPPRFWRDVSSLVAGQALPSQACSLGPRHSISVQGRLKICYWVDSSTLGSPAPSLSYADVMKGRDGFEKDKLRCKVGFHCFCTQNLSHEWRKPGE